MPELLFSASHIYLSECQHLESYIEEVIINPNKAELLQFITIFIVIILVIILVKLHLNGNDNFWPDRGVMLVSTSEVSSILAQLHGRDKRVKDLDTADVYGKLKNKKFVGLMEDRRPVFLIKDVNLAKRILFEDFDHFVVNRQKFMLGKTDSLIMDMLSKLTGLEWREMRMASAAATEEEPTLLSGGRKAADEHLCAELFSHFNSSGAQLVELVRRKSEKVGDHTDGISVTECFGRFTMDVIATACLGVESSRLNEKESPFYKYEKMFQSLGPWRMAKVFIAFLFLRVATLFRISFIEQESRNFLKNIVEHTINHRKNNEPEYSKAAAELVVEGIKDGSLRKYCLQLLQDTGDTETKIDEADLQQSLMTRATTATRPPPKIEKEGAGYNGKSGTTTNVTTTPTPFSSQVYFTDDNDGRSNAGNKLYLTDELILAQSIVCLAESGTTVSHLLSYATYVLAVHPECQEKLYAEIEQCLQSKAAWEHDSVNSIQYMDMFINETLRMYPPATRVEIRCAKEYQVDDTNLKLPRETLVVIPIIAFHYDERYFPDPDKFIAERFSPENRSKIHPSSFIPFGYGPQNRIGMRLAVTGAKTALVHLVHNFIIEPAASTPVPLEHDNFLPLLKPVRMMKIRFRPRK